MLILCCELFDVDVDIGFEHMMERALAINMARNTIYYYYYYYAYAG